MKEAMHASAPEGHGCADCAMDGEACPTCYAAWWRKRHPNHVQVGGEFDSTSGVAVDRHQTFSQKPPTT